MINFLWDNLLQRKKDTLLEFLSKDFFFIGLSLSDLKKLSNFLHVRHYKTGELLFRQNEIGIGMYFILKGRIDIFTEDTTTGEKSEPLFITRLKTGDHIGETALIEENSRRTASAKATIDTTVIGLFQPDLKSLMDSYPDIGARVLLQISKVLSRRLTETATKIVHLKKQIESIKA